MAKPRSEKDDLVVELYRVGMIKTWYRDKAEGWTLVSGLWSPLYIQLRNLCSYPELLREVGKQLGNMIQAQLPGATRLVGIAMAGIPIAVSTSLSIGMPCAMTRKLEGVRTAVDFTYGEHSNIEGELADGDKIVLVDDLVTRFDSKKVALLQLEAEIQQRGLRDIRCSAVAVLFDREQGAREAATKAGIQLISAIPFLSEGLTNLKPYMADAEFETITEYLQNPQAFQSKERQAALRCQAVGN
jgi:orotate phosphoribosyltransferase